MLISASSETVDVSEKHEIRRRRSREEVERLAIEFEASGLRIMEFCRKHGLPPSTLQRHLRKRRLGNVQEKQKSQLGFVSSDGTNGNKDAGGTNLEVVLSNGRMDGGSRCGRIFTRTH
jgi:transposase-like protein